MLVDVIGGFLGSGKTTAILHLLRDPLHAGGRTVLLVNEFGQVGVDGQLLASQGGLVKELPSGCICCSLKADFIGQIEEIAREFAPERIIVEPSGVASMRDLLQALQHGRIAPLIDSVRTVLLLDAADYDWFVEMSPTFVDAQIGLAQLILVNKIDLAEPGLVQTVVDDLERRNPEAVVLPTTFGAFSWSDVAPVLPALPSAEGPSERLGEYESFSAILPETFVLERLRLFFLAAADGHFGDVRRAKGVFLTEDGCMRLDLAGHRLHEAEWACLGAGRVNVIGVALEVAALQRALGAAVQTVGDLSS